jgi:hypothetical protein
VRKTRDAANNGPFMTGAARHRSRPGQVNGHTANEAQNHLGEHQVRRTTGPADCAMR